MLRKREYIFRRVVRLQIDMTQNYFIYLF